jgi:hypothetical protein
MINTIHSSSASAMPQMPRMDNARQLTDEQRQSIKDTLTEFDAGNLSASDAASIVEAFKEAGIRPGSALEAAMAESGFDAKTVGEIAGDPQSSPPGPPPGEGGQAGQLNLSEEMISNLNDLLDEYLGGTLEESKQTSLLAEIKGILNEGAPEDGLVNITV